MIVLHARHHTYGEYGRGYFAGGALHLCNRIRTVVLTRMQEIPAYSNNTGFVGTMRGYVVETSSTGWSYHVVTVDTTEGMAEGLVRCGKGHIDDGGSAWWACRIGAGVH